MRLRYSNPIRSNEGTFNPRYSAHCLRAFRHVSNRSASSYSGNWMQTRSSANDSSWENASAYSLYIRNIDDYQDGKKNNKKWTYPCINGFPVMVSTDLNLQKLQFRAHAGNSLTQLRVDLLFHDKPETAEVLAATAFKYACQKQVHVGSRQGDGNVR